MIPESELRFTYVRSSGPGGQNVNKVNSKAVLRWNIQASGSLSDAAKARFLQLFPSRINADGEVILSSERYRDQIRNREDCIEKLNAMIKSAMTVPKRRKPSKPTRSSLQKRKETKRRHSEKKKMRRYF